MRPEMVDDVRGKRGGGRRRAAACGARPHKREETHDGGEKRGGGGDSRKEERRGDRLPQQIICWESPRSRFRGVPHFLPGGTTHCGRKGGDLNGRPKWKFIGKKDIPGGGVNIRSLRGTDRNISRVHLRQKREECRT